MPKSWPRKAEVLLEYQSYIEKPPIRPSQMYGQACSSDSVTIESWRQVWIDQVKANHAFLGGFKERSLGKLFGKYALKPAIVAGSGPSLAINGTDAAHRGDIPLISCLHNFHFFEDRGVKVDYYVSLDAGPVVLEEVSEGGSKTPEQYWEITKDRTLLAFIGSHPDLIKKWRGPIYVFNAPVPDQKYIESLSALEEFNVYVSNGGNVLGACLYIAKAIFGCNPISYIGADFCFGYEKKFHAWESKYDAKMGHVIQTVDVFGNKVTTWPSYFNFKNWFDYIALTVPGIYINCTEGGTMGAYPDGNVMAIRQMALQDFIEMYRMYEELRASCENPAITERKLLF